MSVPRANYIDFLSLITARKGCNEYGGDMICQCVYDTEILNVQYPVLEFQVGEVEFNHTIKIEPSIYLEIFGEAT